jgi:hypothetical protein
LFCPFQAFAQYRFTDAGLHLHQFMSLLPASTSIAPPRTTPPSPTSDSTSRFAQSFFPRTEWWRGLGLSLLDALLEKAPSGYEQWQLLSLAAQASTAIPPVAFNFHRQSKC